VTRSLKPSKKMRATTQRGQGRKTDRKSQVCSPIGRLDSTCLDFFATTARWRLGAQKLIAIDFPAAARHLVGAQTLAPAL